MLATLRQLSKTWPARLLFLVLVGSFALWGVAGKLVSPDSETVAARVDGTRIEPAEVQRAYTDQLAKLQQAGTAPSPELKQQVLHQVVEQLVLQTVLANEARRLGVTVTDSQVRDATFAVPAFAGIDGRFDHAKFLQVLGRNHFDEPGFIALVREDLARQVVVGAVQAGAAAPAGLVDQLFAFSRETRTAAAVTVASAAQGPVPIPDGAQLRRFWTDNPDLYATPEYRRIKVVVLSPQSIAPGMAVSDAEIAQLYRATSATYDKPERRSVQVIGAPDQGAAGRLQAVWQGDADWAIVSGAAAAAGATATQLADAKQAELPDPALGKAAFAAMPNAVSAPIKGDFGWYVVKVTSITPGSLTTLAQAHDALRAQIGALKAGAVIDDRANKVEDAMAAGGGLDALPADLGLAAVQGTLDAQGNATDGSPAPLPATGALRSDIIAAAFAAKAGEPASLEQLPAAAGSTGAYYAVQVDAIMPPARLAFDQVQARVTADWTAQAQRHLAEVRAAALLTAARGSTLAAAVQSVGGTPPLAVETLPPVTRPLGDAPPQGVPPGLVTPLFGMKPGDVTMVEAPGGFLVAQLQSSTVPAAAADPIGAGQLRTSLNRSAADDVTEALVQALRQRSKVVLNDRVIQQIAGQ